MNGQFVHEGCSEALEDGLAPERKPSTVFYIQT